MGVRFLFALFRGEHEQDGQHRRTALCPSGWPLDVGGATESNSARGESFTTSLMQTKAVQYPSWRSLQRCRRGFWVVFPSSIFRLFSDSGSGSKHGRLEISPRNPTTFLGPSQEPRPREDTAGFYGSPTPSARTRSRGSCLILRFECDPPLSDSRQGSCLLITLAALRCLLTEATGNCSSSNSNISSHNPKTHRTSDTSGR